MQVSGASGQPLGGQLQVVSHEGGQWGLHPVSGGQGVGEPPWKAACPTLCHLSLLGEKGTVTPARLSTEPSWKPAPGHEDRRPCVPQLRPDVAR